MALATKIELARAAVGAVHREFWSRPDLAALLPELQLRTYDLARASVPLMQTALDRCREISSSDAVAAGLIDYLVEHIEEERHHDDWLLDDLEHLGVAREAVRARHPCVTAARLVGAEYYWVRHDHPVALLGYMVALEGGVASEEFVDDVIRRTGLRREGLATWLHHARIDPGHRTDLDDLIDRLPLEGHHTTLLGISALHTVALLADLAAEVMAAAGSSEQVSRS